MSSKRGFIVFFSRLRLPCDVLQFDIVCERILYRLSERLLHVNVRHHVPDGVSRDDTGDV
jgi:hypothetical protein